MTGLDGQENEARLVKALEGIAHRIDGMNPDVVDWRNVVKWMIHDALVALAAREDTERPDGLSAFDALRAAAAVSGQFLLDENADLEDLFERGILVAGRDFTGEGTTDLSTDGIKQIQALLRDTERPFCSASQFESAMFPGDVKRRQRAAESPADAGRRCAQEAIDREAKKPSVDTELEEKTRAFEALAEQGPEPS